VKECGLPSIAYVKLKVVESLNREKITHGNNIFLVAFSEAHSVASHKSKVIAYWRNNCFKTVFSFLFAFPLRKPIAGVILSAC
ncbi:MAG: hypothetical protein AB4038_05485, partial [Prochloraceae cyanobacterium]